ncbi:MAG: phage terminase small subunit P27 family [Bryobacter sp.]|jgi:P27 family predicted phage terminase small subunit|nr:phage terminase small subunit P27 family [Bryobacter sp. CoA8 C33]
MSRRTTAETVQRFQSKSHAQFSLTVFSETACPDWLPVAGKRISAELLPELQRSGAKAIDIGLFVHLCAAFGMAEEAQETLRKEGLVVHNSHGSRKSPAFQIWRDSVSTFNSLAQQFGLSASRVKMSNHAAEQCQ